MSPRMWIDSVIDADVGVGTQFSDVLTSELAIVEARITQATLLRTIIGLDLSRTVHDSGEGSEKIALGIAVVSREANSAGAFPEPGTATDYPTRGWVWRNHYRVWGFAADQPTIFTRRIDLDLRSMRKLDNGVCVLVADITAMEGVSSTHTILGIVRQLWLVG